MAVSGIEDKMAGSQAQDAELPQSRTMRADADRIEILESLLREALIWCPRVPKHPTSAKRQAVGDGWCDLGNRIEAALSGNVAETG